MLKKLQKYTIMQPLFINSLINGPVCESDTVISYSTYSKIISHLK